MGPLDLGTMSPLLNLARACSEECEERVTDVRSRREWEVTEDHFLEKCA